MIIVLSHTLARIVLDVLPRPHGLPTWPPRATALPDGAPRAHDIARARAILAHMGVPEHALARIDLLVAAERDKRHAGGARCHVWQHPISAGTLCKLADGIYVTDARFTRRSELYFDIFVPAGDQDVEYNGVDHESATPHAIDSERETALRAMGYTVTNVSREQLFNPFAFQRLMLGIARQAGIRLSRLPSSFPRKLERLRRFVIRHFLAMRRLSGCGDAADVRGCGQGGGRAREGCGRGG